MTDAEVVSPLHVRVMGVVIAIDVPDQSTRDRIAHQWSRATVAPDAPAEASVSYHDGSTASEDMEDYGLTSRVTLAALEATAGQRVNLHAGGVADGEGRLLALVAPSGTGKTTATLALAARLGYVSDETVSIAPDGTVAPHAKPLSVILDPDRPFEKRQLSPDDLGLLPTPETARLTRLVLLHRGGDGPRGLAHLDRVDALLQLTEQSSSLAKLPRPLRCVLDFVDACEGVWELGYDEIDDHVDALVDLLAGTPSDPYPDQQLVWHDGDDRPHLEFDLEGPLVGRLPWHEAVEIDGELVILTLTKVWLLSGLTATIWLSLDQPRSIEELVAYAERAHGPYAESETRVREAVATLHQEQLAGFGTLA